MRFTLRTLLFAVALACAYLGGRSSVAPLLKEHEQRQQILNQELKAYEKLRLVLDSERNDYKQERNAYTQERNLYTQQTDKLYLEIDRLRARLKRVEDEKRSRLNNQLAFPVNTERAMLGDGINTGLEN